MPCEGAYWILDFQTQMFSLKESNDPLEVYLKVKKGRDSQNCNSCSSSDTWMFLVINPLVRGASIVS